MGCGISKVNDISKKDDQTIKPKYSNISTVDRKLKSEMAIEDETSMIPTEEDKFLEVLF